MGTVQMITASLVMATVGAFADGSARPMVIAFAICGVLAFAIAQVTLRRRSPAAIEVPAE
jgi:DHA1 family bicyclomycin/chloramphenicol resistance-like MFS transporter